MTTILLATAWVVCGVVGYRITRSWYRNATHFSWTRGMRLSEIIFSIFGPLALMINIMIYLDDIIFFKRPKSWDKPAKW